MHVTRPVGIKYDIARAHGLVILPVPDRAPEYFSLLASGIMSNSAVRESLGGHPCDILDRTSEAPGKAVR